MRNIFVLLLASTTLAACGAGGGPTPVSGSAVTTPSTGSTTTTTSTHTFVKPTETKTYQAQGATQSYAYTYSEALHYNKVVERDAAGNPVLDANGFPKMIVDTASRTLTDAWQGDQLYKGEARTVRNPGITVAYDPKNAQYTVNIAQNGDSQQITFQDPAHRTDFNGARVPQGGVPNLETGDVADWRKKGIQYLEVDSGSTSSIYDVSTFFYELPGTTTQYVTYAGFVRNHHEKGVETTDAETTTDLYTTARSKVSLQRHAFVFGEQTGNSAVPTTGTATFNGNMIASMVNNPLLDTDPSQSTYFQWINGTAKVDVNFGTGAISTALNGLTLTPYRDWSPILANTNTGGFTYDGVYVPAGATFAAAGTGTIDLVQKGGFVGTFSSAGFTWAGGSAKVDIVGSSLDGAFYGPRAQEIGASFRIVGGTPDERVDIIGSFTGK